MKNSVKSLLVAAAMTGLLAATTVPVAMADDTKPATTDTKDTTKTKKAKTKKASTTDKDKDKAAKDKNSCKSANGCSSK